MTSVGGVSRYAPDVRLFTSQYQRALIARIEANVSPNLYRPFPDAMGRIFLRCHFRCARHPVATRPLKVRPTSAIRRGSLQRTVNDPSERPASNRPGANRPSAGSPRARMSIRLPSRIVFRIPDSPQGSALRGDLEVSALDTPFSEDDAIMIRHPPPTRPGDGDTLETEMETSICELAAEFDGFSQRLRALSNAQIGPDRAAVLMVEALMSNRRPIASAKTVTRHVRPYVDCFYEIRPSAASASITVEGSIIALDGFFESLRDSGIAAPSSVKSALTYWSGAMGVDLPLTNPTLSIATSTDSNYPPKRPPSMTLETVAKLERMNSDPPVPTSRSIFAEMLIVMTYEGLRFSGVQNTRLSGAEGDSAFGTLTASKTRKTHGSPWPRHVLNLVSPGHRIG